MTARVSVLIAAYNVSDCIGRAITSVQSQSFTDWEIVVVDDASTDGTDRVVEAFAHDDSRIRLVRHRQNGGPGAARRTALEASDGEWVAILDADDAWKPARLERVLAAADKLDVSMIADNLTFYDDALQAEVGVALDMIDSVRPLTAKDLFDRRNADGRWSFGGLKPLIRRSAISHCGANYEPSLRYAEDLHFSAQLLIGGTRAALLATPYYIYTNAIGRISNLRSRGSRTDRITETRWIGCLWIYGDLISRYGQVLAPSLRAEMDCWRKRIEKGLFNARLSRLLRERDLRGVLASVVNHPLYAVRFATLQRVYRAISSLSDRPSSPRPPRRG